MLTETAYTAIGGVAGAIDSLAEQAIALAYCRWPSVKLQLPIRLPAEWEWQWAAAGNTQQDYPWTGAWNPARANSREAGIGRTVAVGLYPLGCSPFGVDDMAGNVWEWGLNLYYQPSDISLSSSEARVLRGGSWGNNPGFARAAAIEFFCAFCGFTGFKHIESVLITFDFVPVPVITGYSTLEQNGQCVREYV